MHWSWALPNDESFYSWCNWCNSVQPGLVSPIMEIIGSLGFAAVIIVGGSQVISGELTTGSFLSFTTALFSLYTPIKRLSSLYNQLQDAIAADVRIKQIFSLKAQIKDGQKEFPQNIEKVTFKNVELKYDDFIALKDISLEAIKGEKFALVGDSGGGKSSLINLIVRFFWFCQLTISFVK